MRALLVMQRQQSGEDVFGGFVDPIDRRLPEGIDDVEQHFRVFVPASAQDALLLQHVDYLRQDPLEKGDWDRLRLDRD